jgi:hypothetical protein
MEFAHFGLTCKVIGLIIRKYFFVAAYCCYSCSDVDKCVTLRSTLPDRPCFGPEPAVGGPGKKESMFLK